MVECVAYWMKCYIREKQEKVPGLLWTGNRPKKHEKTWDDLIDLRKRNKKEVAAVLLGGRYYLKPMARKSSSPSTTLWN